VRRVSAQAGFIGAVVWSLAGACQDTDVHACGHSWDVNAGVVYCSGGKVELTDLARMPNLQRLSLVDAELRLDGGVLKKVDELVIGNPHFDVEGLCLGVPEPKSLILDQSPLPACWTGPHSGVRFLSIARGRPPSVDELRAMPALRTLALDSLDCPVPGCEDTIAKAVLAGRSGLRVRANDTWYPM